MQAFLPVIATKRDRPAIDPDTKDSTKLRALVCLFFLFSFPLFKFRRNIRKNKPKSLRYVCSQCRLVTICPDKFIGNMDGENIKSSLH